ncbi:endonuclease domain-containing protein [Paraburkholderia fungorum]|uniref:endonuclease domain-containing protein n=1 Tax=Paraburkholderia fungorum TaxID=134537 RepID=UPI0038B82FD4
MTNTTIDPSRNFARTKGTTKPHLIMSLAMQAGCCDICGASLTLAKAHSDHDHRNNLPRGALHKHCNAALGAYEGKDGTQENGGALAAYVARWMPNMRAGKMLPAIARYKAFWSTATDNQAAIREAYVTTGSARKLTDEHAEMWRDAWQQFEQASAANPPSHGFDSRMVGMMRAKGFVERPHGWVKLDPAEIDRAMIAAAEHFGPDTVRAALAMMEAA